MKTESDNYYRERAVKRLVIIVAVIVVVGGAVWYFLRSDPFQKISALEISAKQIATEELSKTFSAPTPLATTTTPRANSGNGSVPGPEYMLTREGVIADTNTQRATNGNLPALVEDPTLDEIASLRLDDMFAHQYFAHISPSSSSAETVAAAVGYNYIDLGENLALGDFNGDQGVVIAWMNSPGHRANILGAQYTQIGVAVGEGVFQGYQTWIAVQVFGRPASACPVPDSSLKSEINTAESQITQMQEEIQNDEAQINAMQPKSGNAYNQAVNDYNTLVNQYNILVTQTKTQVTQYNGEADTYNICVGEVATTTATSSQ